MHGGGFGAVVAMPFASADIKVWRGLAVEGERFAGRIEG